MGLHRCDLVLLKNPCIGVEVDRAAPVEIQVLVQVDDGVETAMAFGAGVDVEIIVRVETGPVEVLLSARAEVPGIVSEVRDAGDPLHACRNSRRLMNVSTSG